MTTEHIIIAIQLLFIVLLLIIVKTQNWLLKKEIQQSEQLNNLNDGLCKENLDLMDKLLEAGI